MTIVIIATVAVISIAWLGLCPTKPKPVTFEIEFSKDRMTIQNTSARTLYLYLGNTAKGAWLDLPEGNKLNAQTPPEGLRITTEKP